jgi:hypothetical protein
MKIHLLLQAGIVLAGTLATLRHPVLCGGHVLGHTCLGTEMGRYRPAVSEYAGRDPGR